VTVALVAVAGALGVVTRYGIGTAFPADSLPWVTVAINVAGSALLGLLVAAGQGLPAELRVPLAVGFLGGFTTFSTFAVDAFLDIDAGRGGEALLLVGASVVLGVAAAGAGYALGRAIV